MSADAVEFAFWYHDVVYDTKTKDSEERNAVFAIEVVKNASLPDDFGQLVASLIMATKHSAALIDFDVRLLIDIDLSILGQSEDKFDEYE